VNPRKRSAGLCALLAVAAYAVISLWAYRAVVADPYGRLVTSVSEGPMAKIARFDQSVAVANTARHAHVLLTDPSRLLDGDHCYPLPRSHTLGEHMFGIGLLATIPYVLSQDPIFSFNAVLVLSVVIAGIAMYAFSYHYLRDPLAAFLSGLLFALALPRVFGPGQPFANADMWTPLAMLFLHRLFAFGGVGNALGFAGFAGLIVLQSIYPLVSGTILLVFYALHLAWAYRRQLVARLPAMAVALAALAVPCVFVLVPYLEARDTWPILANRPSIPRYLSEGWLLNAASLLTIVGMLDRMRGRRPASGPDPRLCFFAAALFLLWAASFAIPIPGTGIRVPSPLRLIRAIVPGSDAVRGLSAIGLAIDLPLAFLGGYGVHAIVERSSRRTAILLTAALGLYVTAERLYPPLSGRIYAFGPKLSPWAARPAPEDIELLRRTDGPILDLPHAADKNLKSWAQADHLRFTSFDPRPSSSCYASFPSPIDAPIFALAKAMPDPKAADALYALGFRTVLMHVLDAWPPELKRFEGELTTNRASRIRLREIGRTSRLIAYRLSSPVGASSDLAPLAEGPFDAGSVRVAPGAKSVDVTIVNSGRMTFVQPPPIQPTDVLVRWSDASGGTVSEERARFLLPLALGRQASQALPLSTTAPASPGRYSLTVAPVAQPELVIARLTVDVDPSVPVPPARGAPVKPAAAPGSQTKS
jgi:hypothetical protein